MSAVVLVGNPRAASRTHRVAAAVAEAVLPGVGFETVDLGALGPRLLASEASAAVEDALLQVARARVLVVASPTYKGTYTGLLKVFLDRLPPGALAGTSALPVMVMADPRHASAVEVHLRPLLAELGAAIPARGLAVLESQLDRLDEVVGPWADGLATLLHAEVPA
ncbi:NADPH-dependent FMN reductase [Rhizohabitans arisaemae]|uniref:NADPH-dependent FMN reductase n=1 Tax=Rhizohabitans arisaemae TaxID=2720610 RepID=UPI0024B0EA9A|nr:NAD(P)H-dependent oxidoreductase [Rhizohabitans arisaemae]